MSLEEIVPVEENPDDPGVPKGFASNKLVETAVEKKERAIIPYARKKTQRIPKTWIQELKEARKRQKQLRK